MPTVQEILLSKGNEIHTIRPEATVLDATKRMNQHKIGALVVMQDNQVVGMFTERDVLRRVVAEQRNPAELVVADVMTTDVICAEPESDMEDAANIMKTRRVRHLPVCDCSGNLLGLISMGDLNAQHASTQEQTIHFLSDYIYGRV